MIVSTAALCLALNVFHEARSQMIPGQYAVALVTLNRADHDKRQVCTEVFKHKQFSWANKGVTKVKGGWKLAERLRPKEAYAWWLAQRIAAVSLSGQMSSFMPRATFYHEVNVKPIWRLSMVEVKQIGSHKFYILPD